MKRLAVVVLLLSLPGVAGCGDDQSVRHSGSSSLKLPEAAVGAWSVDARAVEQAFVRADEAMQARLEAERRADLKDGPISTEKARNHHRSDARHWSAEYARVFRMDFAEDGTVTVTVPRMAVEDGETRVVSRTERWEHLEDGIALSGDGYQSLLGPYARINHLADRLHLTKLQVVIPQRSSRGRFGRRILTSLPLVTR